MVKQTKWLPALLVAIALGMGACKDDDEATPNPGFITSDQEFVT